MLHDVIDTSHLPDPLPVPVTEGESGPWRIRSFSLTENDAMWENIKFALRGRRWKDFMVKPATYTKLVHQERGVVMSNTPMEVTTNLPFIKRARGRVLINGLGLGMVLRAVLDKPEVTWVTVYEIDQDVIDLVGAAFLKDVDAGRLSIRRGNCLKHEPLPTEFYDIAWHDVWDTISDLNLPEMQALRLKWKERVPEQLCWAEPMCREMHRIFQRIKRESKRGDAPTSATETKE